MHYLGSKSKIAKPIAEILHGCSRPIWEPFCGALNISQYLPPRSILSDLHCSTIYTYRAMLKGWAPPDNCTEEEYRSAQFLPDNDPLKGFLGHACSFGGKWFDSYAKNSVGRNYCLENKKSLTKRLSSSSRSIFRIDFLEVEPFPLPFAIYCDPPYFNTTDSLHFDYHKFLNRVSEWSKLTTVYVSEYNFPLGKQIWQKTISAYLNAKDHGDKRDNRTERLYLLGDNSTPYDLSFSEYSHWIEKFKSIEVSQND